jgi:hypothetical protein
VRTGPLPCTSGPSPLISVVVPTSTPATSVIALNGPGFPENGSPQSRPRFTSAINFLSYVDNFLLCKFDHMQHYVQNGE